MSTSESPLILNLGSSSSFDSFSTWKPAHASSFGQVFVFMVELGKISREELNLASVIQETITNYNIEIETNCTWGGGIKFKGNRAPSTIQEVLSAHFRDCCVTCNMLRRDWL